MASKNRSSVVTRALLSPTVERVIDDYRTRRRGTDAERAAAEQFAKGVVRVIGARDGKEAGHLLTYLAGLALWCQREGLALDPRVALRESTIERYVSSGLERERSATRKTTRSVLYFVARALVPDLVPAKREALSKGDPAEPYSDEQVGEYLRLAAAQPTDLLVDALTALICAAAGGGVGPDGLRHLRGVDVRRHRSAVVLHVQGRTDRTTPVDEPFGAALAEIAQRRPMDYLVSGDRPTRKNVTNHLTSRLHGGEHLPPLTVARLRATWTLRKLRHTHFKELCDAAGIAESAQLFRLLRYIPKPTLDETVDAIWQP